MKKVDEADRENQTLRQAGEQKDKDIRQLQAEIKALRKNCDAEVCVCVCVCVGGGRGGALPKVFLPKHGFKTLHVLKDACYGNLIVFFRVPGSLDVL